ncbi:hypothetical protein [Caballeronia sp. LZ043]|uniref:hypothetical protein n=1 Tax=Caballeronia sp. LZ043 TaxID=3038569 RepID=UPI002858F2DB|nr:hypothetical protein [Caballeronia sp. LZ043]MDR5823574.1 hypothetical protein [Caballeronia sp. LZ043]
MDRPAFEVTAGRIGAYAAMFDITLSADDCTRLARSLSAGLAGLAALRAVNVDGVEPFVAFPIDRVQS